MTKHLRSSVIAIVFATSACSENAHRPAPSGDDGLEFSSEPSTSLGESSRTTHATSDGGGVGAKPPAATERDAGDAAAPNLLADAAAVESGDGGPDEREDASVIQQPTEQPMTPGQLCARALELEGQVLIVDLGESLTRGAWADLDDPRPDAAADADACPVRLAPYVLPCEGGVFIVSDSLGRFGEGPRIGGEPLNLGCWQAGCEEGCLPETPAEVGEVRLRVNGPINGAFDEDTAVYSGQVRLNGVDFDALGNLEVLGRR